MKIYNLRLLKTISSDIEHYYTSRDIHAAFKPLGFLLVILPVSSLYSLSIHRFGTWINWKYGFHYTKSPVRSFLKILYKIGAYANVAFRKTQIEEDSQVGKGIWLSNRGGILLGPIKIGDNCTIHHNVTIGYGFGAKRDMKRPVIGNNVRIGPNSIVFGGIKIGNGVTIKTNSVVHKNIPDHCVVAGNPCRIKKHKIV